MLVLGHRGASAHFSENTLPAFRGALDDGADGVELDVRRTADGSLAVRHEPTLPDGRPLLALSETELPGEIPLLGAALDVLRPATVVNVEIKNWPDDPDFDASEELAERVVALLEERDELDDGRLLVSAFHLPTVDRVHELAPGLATGWLVLDALDPGPLVERVAKHGHVALHPHHVFVNEELVRVAHTSGLAVNTWTCDDADRIAWLADIGVDAVVTNHPLVALRALAR